MELFGPLAAAVMTFAAVFSLFRMLKNSDVRTADELKIDSKDK
jgi:hypothetical protein